MQKPHKFDIGEGYGIWEADGETHRSFPDVFLRAKPGDGAGKFRIGDDVVLRQPCSKTQFGMFLIANVETGDFGGTGLKYKITVHPVGTPEALGAGKDRSKTLRAGTEARHPDTEDSKSATARARTTYEMKRIALADCKPHADAEAYSCSTEDRAALANSVAEAGVLSPIAVVPDEDGKGYYVIDGIGRMNALIAAGETETDAQVFDLGGMSVAEFVVSKNSMMRKVTTGTRVMAYLKCHEREVLAAADPEKYQRRPGNDGNFKPKSHAVSCETAWDRSKTLRVDGEEAKSWSAKEIAERIGVSKQDVLAGIELLKATVEAGEDDKSKTLRTDGGERAGAEARHPYELGDLFETMEAVLRGETPIRRWKAAASGKVSKTGGKAAADYEGIAIRTMKSLAGVWYNWQTVPMESRAAILRLFGHALNYLPEDFRAVIGEWAREQEPATAKGKKRR